MASPSVEKRARALGGTGSKTLGKQVKDVVSIVDVYRVRPRRPSLIGGLVSVAVIPATAVFVWALYADLKTSPPVESQEIMWTYDEGPYKAPLRCEAPGGCWVSNAYGDDSHHPSGLVASEKDCFFLGYKENTTVHLAYSFEPFEGLSVLAERPTPANPNFQVASILSDMNYWKGRFIDNEGVVVVRHGRDDHGDVGHHPKRNAHGRRGEAHGIFPSTHLVRGHHYARHHGKYHQVRNRPLLDSLTDEVPSRSRILQGDGSTRVEILSRLLRRLGRGVGRVCRVGIHSRRDVGIVQRRLASGGERRRRRRWRREQQRPRRGVVSHARRRVRVTVDRFPRAPNPRFHPRSPRRGE